MDVNSSLQVFEFEARKVRIVMMNGEPWWVAKDVCDALGYVNGPKAVADHCKYSERMTITDRQGQKGGAQFMTIIPESDMYRLIIRSNLPEAQRFEAWVMEKALPSVRKYGAYMTPQKIEEVLLNPDTIINLAQTLKKEQAKISQLSAKIEEDRPKVLFADSVSASHTSILIGELAKLLRQNGVEIGQNRLFEKLREEGYLMKDGSSRNMPTQRSMELELFEVKETTINRSDGGIDVKKTPKVTGRGQVFFIHKFCGKREGAGISLNVTEDNTVM